MFLDKKYILANELVQKMGIHIANVSMLRKSFEHNDDYYSIRKMNNCSFVSAKAYNLPNNIKQGIKDHKFTDVSNKLPCTYFKSEFNVTERELTKSGIVLGKMTIAGKKFYVFSNEFVQNLHDKVGYILDAKENEKCLKDSSIDGSVQLSRNKFFAWY
jgi:hypothetical protein